MQTHIKPMPSSTANQFEKAMVANDAAVARFNALSKSLENDDPAAFTQEEDRLLDGLRQPDRAVPTSWSELERWVTHITNDGKADVDRDNAERLLTHVRRLLTPVTNPAEWDAALVAYKQAEATMSEYDRSNPDDTEELSNANADACAEAAERLLNMLAPHDAALAWKLDYLFAPDANGGSAAYAHSFIKQTLDDAVRLASAGQPSALA